MIVNWDGMPKVEGWEDSCESAQRLFTSLYNKDKEGAWRMDVNVELCEAYDPENDCEGSGDEISSDDNDTIEEEDDSDN